MATSDDSTDPDRRDDEARPQRTGGAGEVGDRMVEASAGAMPTPEEEEAARRAAEHVDLERVGEHEREMTRLGAEIQGEGEIEPR